jgi:hypothetical protein
VVVCMSPAWTRARYGQTLSLFQSRLLGLADRVVEAPVARTEPSLGRDVPALSLF